MPDDLPIHRDNDSKKCDQTFSLRLPDRYRKALACVAIEKNVGMAESLKQAVMFYMNEVHGLGQSD
jgi:hypothetical protein